MENKKVLVFDYDKMVRAGRILNVLQFVGTTNIRLAAELADILDSGAVMEMEDKGKEDVRCQ